MTVTRRKFVGGSLALGGALALSASPILRGLGHTTEVQAAAENTEKVFRTACNVECNHCGFMVHVRNGRAVRIKPDPNFYLRPCLRGYSHLQWTYHPDRLKYPFKRVGKRGEGKWERISWDEALDTIAEKFGTIRQQYGPEALFCYSGAIMSTTRYFMMNRFANAFGKGVFTNSLGVLCCSAQEEGEVATLGYRPNAWETMSNARLIINWSSNPVQTYHAHWYLLADALEAGAYMVTIDPRFSDTATKSDQWLAPRPGTDLGIIMGMINVIIKESLYDRDFVLAKTNLPFLVNENTGKLLKASEAGIAADETGMVVWDSVRNAPIAPKSTTTPVLDGSFTVNGIPVRTVFARLREQASKYDADKITAITGVLGNEVIKLARVYATTKPALIFSCMSGGQRTSYGEYFVAGMVYLAALTGNLGIPGGGIHDIGGPLVHGIYDVAGLIAPYPPAPKGNIPVTKIGEWIAEGKPHPIKAIYWSNSGLGQHPNNNKMIEAFNKVDFVVVQDHFFGDAASLADIVLPAATIFECTELLASHINYYYQLIDGGIEPMWEARSDNWIYGQLAQRLGFGNDFNRTDEEWVDFLLKPAGLSAQILREKGPVRQWDDARYNQFKIKVDGPMVFFRDTPFKTSSGRVEFHSSRWESKGFAPMADYFAPEEGPEKTPDLYKKYPLNLIAAKIRTKVHSSFAMMPWLSEIYPKGWVEINTSDAEARGIKNGDMVEVFNDRGQIQIKALVHSGIRPNTVMIPNGWWVQQGTNAGQLTNNAPSAINYGHTLNNTLVEVRRA